MASTYTISPCNHQFFDDAGDPLSAGRVYTYASGTSDALTTYKTSAGTAWGAFVQLDSAGRPENGEIYLQPGQSYKWIIKDEDGVTVDTVDPIQAMPASSVNVDIEGTAGEALTAGQIAYIGTNGSWFRADADALASSMLPVMGFVVADIASGDTGTFRTDGQIELSGPLSPESKYYVSATAGEITSTKPTLGRLVGQAQSTSILAIALNPPIVIDPQIKSLCNGRLSLTTGVPVTTANVTAATTLYWVPYKGNTIGLYTGTGWVSYAFSQLSIAVPATTSQMYDVFVDYNSGTPALSLTAWTNDSTRATALTTQDGVYVLTGATTKRYVGSFRTTGVSGQTEDSESNRLVWNYYNRVERALKLLVSTATWTYTTSTWRQANNSAANQVTVVVGVAEDAIELESFSDTSDDSAAAQGTYGITGIGVDSTTAPSGWQSFQSSALATGYVASRAGYNGVPAAGYHAYALLEFSAASGGTRTWYGASQRTGIVSRHWQS